MKRVTGIGGVFFKAKDVAAINNWYRDQLGFKITEWGAAFTWEDTDPSNKQICSTAWSTFKEDTKHFAPSTLPFMFNYRVHDLKGLIDTLRSEGVEVVGGIDEYDYGKFAWIMDPEGRKIELWEPIDGGFGPPDEPWDKVIGLAGLFFESEDPEKTKQWYKKHLDIGGEFFYKDRTTKKQMKIEWSPISKISIGKPYYFAYYVKNISSDSSLLDPEGNKVVLYPV